MTGIPERDFLAVPSEELSLLERYGSTFTQADDGTYTWHFPYPDPRISLTLGPYGTVSPAIDAGFEVPDLPMELKAIPIAISINGDSAKAPPPVSLMWHQNGTLEAQMHFSFQQAGCSMHAARTPGGLQTEGVCGSCTACIDNNGLWSFAGCRTSRWVGFPGSDCHMAWVIFNLCGHPNDGYCINGRNCSPLIRHSPCWHRG